jgi:hypothetical protein
MCMHCALNQYGAEKRPAGTAAAANQRNKVSNESSGGCAIREARGKDGLGGRVGSQLNKQRHTNGGPPVRFGKVQHGMGMCHHQQTCMGLDEMECCRCYQGKLEFGRPPGLVSAANQGRSTAQLGQDERQEGRGNR